MGARRATTRGRTPAHPAARTTALAMRSARPDPAPTPTSAPRTRSRTRTGTRSTAWPSTTPTPSPRPSALTTADTVRVVSPLDARALATVQLHGGDQSARALAWVFAGVQAFAQAPAEAFACHALASARSSFAFAGN